MLQNDRPVRLVPIGLGNRTRKYLKYVETHPEAGRVSAIVEPYEVRRNQARERYGLGAEESRLRGRILDL